MNNNKLVFCVVALTASLISADTSKLEALVTSDVKSDVKLDLKIRYVDAMEIIQHSQVGKTTGQELMDTQKKWADEINKRGKELEQEMIAYEAKRSTMSEAARDKQDKYFAKAKRDYQAYVEEKQQDLQKEQAKANDKIFKEVRESAAAVAKAENIDVIVEKMSGQVLFNSSKADFSNKIIAHMDKKAPTAKSSTAVADAKKPAAKANA